MSIEAKQTEILYNVLGAYQRSGDELLFYCPFCHHHKRKLSVNLAKNKYKCWVCNEAGKVIRLVSKYGTEAARHQWEQVSGIATHRRIGETTDDRIVTLPVEFKTLVKEKMSSIDIEPLMYLKSRGLTFDDICAWRIGYCYVGDYAGRVIVPSFDSEGDLNYFVSRSYSDAWPKYKNPDASKDVIFNDLSIDWWSGEVTLVEGVFDAIVAKDNAIPLLGSTLKEDSKLFRKVVQHCHTVYMALDPDAIRKENKIIQKLVSYDIEVRKIHIPHDKDVGSMTREEYLSHKESAESVDFQSNIMYRMMAAYNSGSAWR